MRVFFFNYCKAFDLIDHGTLVAKLKKRKESLHPEQHYELDYRFPKWAIGEGYTQWDCVPLGVPQGTRTF